jgi:hypothetical protein
MFTFPVHQYDHSGGRCSITGGFVYRGALSPTLAGHYFFADFCSSDLYSLTTPDNGMTWNVNSFGAVIPGLSPTTFGEDSSGELYVTGFNGTVYRITETAPPAVCGTPQTGCTATAKSNLKIKRPSDPSKNKLIWKWLAGPALTQSDFGDPTTGATSYSLCIYAGTTAAITAQIPSPAGWKAVSTKGYKFSDSSAGGDGIFKVLLKADAAGKSKLLVKGKGANLDLSALPLNGPSEVLVQLLRSDDPTCFEATFPAASFDADDAAQFKAKIP